MFTHPFFACRAALAAAALMMLLARVGPAAELTVPGPDALTSFPLTGLPERYLAEPRDARFARGTSETVWVSDIEHVFFQKTGDLFLADSTSPVVMARDRIGAGHRFELFPYHYVGRDEIAHIGRAPRYRLAMRNDTTSPLVVDLEGSGTVEGWEHGRAWAAALRGEGKTTVRLEPGAEHTLWQTGPLRGDLPWSAVVFGRTSGELTVVDYCFAGERDPGSGAALMPDLAWQPWLLASFTRGTAPWFTGTVALLPERRDAAGDIPLSAFRGQVSSLAFGYSPGGPVTDLCEYKAVQPTFVRDELVVRDPLTGWSHPFFGGNYPVRYRVRLPVRNDLDRPARLDAFLASNDQFGVDTAAGIWVDGRLTHREVPALKKGARWHAWSLSLRPGERGVAECEVIALGGRWGAIILSVVARPAP